MLHYFAPGEQQQQRVRYGNHNSALRREKHGNAFITSVAEPRRTDVPPDNLSTENISHDCIKCRLQTHVLKEESTEPAGYLSQVRQQGRTLILQ